MNYFKAAVVGVLAYALLGSTAFSLSATGVGAGFSGTQLKDNYKITFERLSKGEDLSKLKEDIIKLTYSFKVGEGFVTYSETIKKVFAQSADLKEKGETYIYIKAQGQTEFRYAGKGNCLMKDLSYVCRLTYKAVWPEMLDGKPGPLQEYQVTTIGQHEVKADGSLFASRQGQTVNIDTGEVGAFHDQVSN
jgi:hypothetical protein